MKRHFEARVKGWIEAKLEQHWRALMHIPVGVLIFEFGWASPMLSLVATALFLAYKLSKRDRAWKDIFGVIVGFALAFLFHFGIMLIGIIVNDIWAWGKLMEGFGG